MSSTAALTALTAQEVGKLLRYPAPRVRAMYRAGNFPAPIDPDLPVTAWRWSPRTIDVYVNGVDGEVAA